MNRREVMAGLGTAAVAGIIPFPVLAGETLNLEGAWTCGFFGELRVRGSANVNEAPRAAAIVTRRITDLVGLVQNFALREADFEKGGTAYAIIQNNKRYVVFDRAKFDWGAGRPSWRDIGILAHEIGHHLNGHTSDGSGSRWQTEAEADWFAGYVAARLGATREDVLPAFRFLSEDGSKTHPPRRMRLKAVEAGWRHARRQMQSAGS